MLWCNLLRWISEYYRRNIPNIYTPANGAYEKEDLAQYNRFVRDAVIGKLTNPNIITPM